MITPGFGLTATERVLPRLALDFTTAVLDPRVTFTRAGNTATVINSSGVIVGINADLPRFDYNPTTLVCRGLLLEESRTNVLLNSLIDGTILGTQAVVVTAAARTLSFYGTGQVVLSGAASSTVIGTDAYPTRTTFTFTPSAGVLTLTVTGTVQFAQLELGSFATSYIPTTVSQVTRSADVATMTGTNFSDWYNASEGAFVAQATPSEVPATDALSRFAVVASGTDALRLERVSGNFRCVKTVSGSSSVSSTFAWTTGDSKWFGAAYKLNSNAAVFNAQTPSALTGTLLSGMNALSFGTTTTGASNWWDGHIQKVMYFPQRLTNAELQAFTK